MHRGRDCLKHRNLIMQVGVWAHVRAKLFVIFFVGQVILRCSDGKKMVSDTALVEECILLIVQWVRFLCSRSKCLDIFLQ